MIKRSILQPYFISPTIKGSHALYSGIQKMVIGQLKDELNDELDYEIIGLK